MTFWFLRSNYENGEFIFNQPIEQLSVDLQAPNDILDANNPYGMLTNEQASEVAELAMNYY